MTDEEKDVYIFGLGQIETQIKELKVHLRVLRWLEALLLLAVSSWSVIFLAELYARHVVK